MGLFSAIDISASGLTAERFRMDIIASNIANVNTTRTQSGGPYRRKMPVFAPYIKEAMANSEVLPAGGVEGVKVIDVVEDSSPLRMVYNPSHPDADKNGYVAYPNVNIVTEMVDMISASRAYEANTAVIDITRNMANRALAIGK